MKLVIKGTLLLLASALVPGAAEKYQKPPQAVLDVLNAPAIPTLSVSPDRTHAISGQPVRYPPIAELSQPMLRLAGQRINPRTNGLHNTIFNSELVLWKLPEGTRTPVDTPPGAKLGSPRFSPDGKRFAFTNTTARGIELWVGDTATGKAHRIEGVRLNGVMAGPGGGRGGRRWRRIDRTAMAAR